jgi:hypothetical protein
MCTSPVKLRVIFASREIINSHPHQQVHMVLRSVVKYAYFRRKMRTRNPNTRPLFMWDLMKLLVRRRTTYVICVGTVGLICRRGMLSPRE